MSGSNRDLITRVYDQNLGFMAKVRIKGKKEWLWGRIYSNVFMQRHAARTYTLNELTAMERVTKSE